MISNFCRTALKELSQHKNTDREDLLLQHINARLTKSFDTYQKEIDTSIEYLKRRNELSVVRKMNRLK